ncbi:hypothetical protein [Thermococcus sp.]
MKGIIYNVEGISIPVEFTPGIPFRFQCSSNDCGKNIVLEGIIIEAKEEEFTKVLEAIISNDPSFEKIRDIRSRKFLFKGRVNGKDVVLPVESLQDLVDRFLDEILVLKG